MQTAVRMLVVAGRAAWVGLALLVCVAQTNKASYQSMNTEVAGFKDGPLDSSSTIRDVLNHPALAGFGRLILPWDDRRYDEKMPLSEIGALLPYHTHVNTPDVVTALNRMIEDASSGKAIFYNFYPEDQKWEQPAKANTGLFFFRGRHGAPFAVVCPGGGFSYVGALHEGFPYAIRISDSGYNAFVLRYRVGHGGTFATRDLAAAISYIFRNAKTLGIRTDGYSVWGSSAGARMAASIGTHGVSFYGGDALPKPIAVVMAYTAHSEYSSDDPPTFVVAGERDGIAPPYIMERRIASLRRSGTPVEYHRYNDVEHGFGPGTGTSAEGWIEHAIRFWERLTNKSNSRDEYG